MSTYMYICTCTVYNIHCTCPVVIMHTCNVHALTCSYCTCTLYIHVMLFVLCFSNTGCLLGMELMQLQITAIYTHSPLLLPLIPITAFITNSHQIRLALICRLLGLIAYVTFDPVEKCERRSVVHLVKCFFVKS